jgi:hypothetical protein
VGEGVAWSQPVLILHCLETVFSDLCQDVRAHVILYIYINKLILYHGFVVIVIFNYIKQFLNSLVNMTYILSLSYTLPESRCLRLWHLQCFMSNVVSLSVYAILDPQLPSVHPINSSSSSNVLTRLGGPPSRPTTQKIW